LSKTLLTTQRYSETINLLYSSYTFDFRYPDTLKSFCNVVPHAQLDMIHSIQLTCDFWNAMFMNERHHRWTDARKNRFVFDDMCEVLASLKELRLLRIEHQERDWADIVTHVQLEEEKEVIVKGLSVIKQAEVIDFNGLWSSDPREAVLCFRLTFRGEEVCLDG
jgi:hypothetical protein